MCRIVLKEEIDSESLEISPREEKRNHIIEGIRHKIMDIPIFNREKKYEDYLKNRQNKTININFVAE